MSGLKITADFNMSDVEAYIKQETEVWFNNILETYRDQGRKAVDRARAKTKPEGGFGNITWNLRGSIGMCLTYRGEIVETYFPPIGKGEHGNMVGRELAERLAIYNGDPNGITMVIVAGEDYAIYVQTVERDVINGSTTKFTDDITALLK